jgi:hypothetical protein
MRDVKTTGRIDDGTCGGPDSDPPGYYLREVWDPGVRSLLGEKLLMGPVRNLDPRQSAPYLENNGVCMEAKTTGFSAGSYTAIVLHRALTLFGVFMRITPITKAGAIAVPPYYLYMMTRSLSLTHYEHDKLCIWGVNPVDKEILARNGIRLSHIIHDNKRASELLGGSNHRYSELVDIVQDVRQTDGGRPAPVDIPLATVTMMAPVNLNTDIGLASMGFMVIRWFVVGLRPKDRQFFFQELAELLRQTVGTEGDSFEQDSDRLDQ